jgi:hypothetical protein
MLSRLYYSHKGASPSVSTSYVPAVSLSSPALPPYKGKKKRPHFQIKPQLYFDFILKKVWKMLGYVVTTTYLYYVTKEISYEIPKET